MSTPLRAPLLFATPALALLPLACSSPEPAPFQDTGGVLIPEQAAYDVLHYDLAIEVDPSTRTIDAVLTVRARATADLSELVLDLDGALEVTAAREGEREHAFEHRAGRVRVDLGETRSAGEELTVAIAYGGEPREAPRPPWEGGFTWAETESGEPWVVTSNQMQGADLWWPCKDHPSDKPEGVDLHVTVPASLVCASNGRFMGVDDLGDGRRTWNWKVTTPISNYCVALNIAPYVEVTRDYTSVTGEVMPVTFWCLPESEEKAAAILPEFLDHLRFFEELLGPYPFRADKYGIVETPHLGMEHQTIIAYGNQFRDFNWEYDWLHHHELAHEWYANLVTAPDWNDFWIHEGFGSYLQKLYVEETHGREAYHEYLDEVRGRISNLKAVAPREPRTSAQMYFVDRDAPPGELRSDNDIYFKGEWILHTLRYLVGDEPFNRSLRRMCYPDPALEQVTDGSHCRFGTTEDYRALIEEETGRDLAWFFEVYLRQPELPRLESTREGDELRLAWKVPEGLSFPMPVEVDVDGERLRVAMPDGQAILPVPAGAEVELDPDDEVLRVGNRAVADE